ncbi:hypothetical protein [uncultured Methylobacterium sp.]|uniref:rhamnosyltransferase WsaF family glycosyltransferase n=1 Tax=uncultured Methylobacterium sp. TaxID=157278 RepID=UPI0035CB49E4
MTRRYDLPGAQVVRFVLNPAIASGLTRQVRERIIVVYGRPGTPRNAFPTLCAALLRWQQADPMSARAWRIVSAGEAYPAHRAGGIENLEVVGKLSFEAYADLLSRASVGISLMLSPHRSYSPLEMAQAGLLTITNGADAKDLSRRCPGIVSLEHATPDALATAIEAVVAEAAATLIGRVRDPVPIEDLPCPIPDFDAGALAARLNASLALPTGRSLGATTDYHMAAQ